MKKNNNIAAIIVAAGSGQRIGNSPVPKQYAKINNQRLLYYTIKAFASHADIGPIVVAIRPEDTELFQESVADIKRKDILHVTGGAERQNSVYNALEFLQKDSPQYVLIHDGVRPFVSHNLISKVINSLLIDNNTGVVPVLPITDTIKRITNNKVICSVNRSELFAAQTPQGFLYHNILMCHRLAKIGMHTDDSSIMESYNLPMVAIPGETTNIKITQSIDLKHAQEML